VLPALVLLILADWAAAQSPRWQRIIYGIEVRDEAGDLIDHPFLGGFNLPRPQLADSDGDGDLDLFLQEHSDRIMFFRNDGSGASAYRWVTDAFEELSVGEWYRFTDVDLDGDLDLLAEEPYSYIRYYRNDGGSGPARYVLAADTLKDIAGEPIFSDRQNIPNAADIDCDGQLDLLIGRLTGTITRYEAEDTDQNGVPRFRHITVPLLLPVIVVAITLRTIAVVNSPDLMIILTGGGPGLATHVLSFYAFQTAYATFDFGYAAALSVVMLGILIFFTLIYLRVAGVDRD